ncbi:MAG: aminotransferase class IV [Amaricoccus sp.]
MHSALIDVDEGPAARRSAVAVPFSPDLKLIETFGRTPDGRFPRLPAHLARLARTAAALGVAPDWPAIDRVLAAITGEGALRIRLTVTLDGAPAAETAPLAPNPPAWTVALARERLDSADPWLVLKTDRRPVHDAARAARAPGIDEALLANERGELCEGTTTTVFADFGRGLLTPPLASGLLPGVLRAEMLGRGQCREAVIEAASLAAARRLLVGNSLRGLLPARLAGSA